MLFYLDEDLSQQIALIARAMGIDVLSSHECGRDGLSDTDQFRLAAAEGRCFVTVNRDDFIRLTVRFAEEQQPHAGLLIVPWSFPPKDAVGVARALVAFAREHPDGVQPYTIGFLHRPRELDHTDSQ